MSTARALLLEIKRKLDTTSTPYPDEVNALAFLNEALQGIYNYGVMLRSEKLKKFSELETGTTGEVTVSDGIMYIKSIVNKTTGKELIPLTDMNQYRNSSVVNTQNNPPYYTVDGNKIKLFPETTSSQTIILEYFPQLSSVKRNDEVPFTPDLNATIKEWTIALIANKDSNVNDMVYAVCQQYGNSMSRYFRDGQFKRLITGRGIW